MADEFLRIGGRSEEGYAKPIQTDQEGRLIKSPDKITHTDFHRTQREVSNGETVILTDEKRLKLDITGTSPHYKVIFDVRGDAQNWTRLMGVETATFETMTEIEVNESGTKTNIFAFDVEGYHSIRFRINWLESNDESEWVSVRGAFIW